MRVSVPVLSVQMKVTEPSVSTASSRLYQRVLGRHGARAPGQRERHGRQQALGDQCDGDSQGEQEALHRGEPKQLGRSEQDSADAD